MRANKRRPAATRAKRRGVTIIELTVTLGILAILMAIAVPSMQQLIARKRVAGVAGELASDIRYLQSLGVQTANPMQIDFGADSTSTWYNLSVDANERGPCTVPADCNGLLKKPTTMKFISLKISDGISVASSTPNTRFIGANSMPIDGAIVRATISSSLGGSVKVQTNAAGRPFACSISGQESNFPVCI